MSESKHTPVLPVKVRIDTAENLPLAIVADTEDGDGLIELGERTPENLAIAARIVQCWNEYDQLKAENERLKADANELAEGYNKYFNKSSELAQEVKALEEANRELVDGFGTIKSILSNWAKAKGDGSYANEIDYINTILAKYNTTKQEGELYPFSDHDKIIEKLTQAFCTLDSEDREEIKEILQFHSCEPKAAAEKIADLLNTDPDNVFKYL